MRKNFGILQLPAALLLVGATFIWGSAFVAQKTGSESVGSFTFCFYRSVIASAALAVAAAILTAIRKKRPPRLVEEPLFPMKKQILVGMLCGTALTVASVFQQLGISDPSVSTAQSGFLTALYVIFVPLAGLFFGQKMKAHIWVGCFLGLGGMLLLCLGGADGFDGFTAGTVWLLLCAVFYTVHILLLDRFSASCDSLWLSCVQFTTMTVLCLPGMLIEHNPASAIRAALFPILYAGLLSSGVAYTIQVFTQRILHPALASLIMCFESVFALLCGWWFLGDKPKSMEGAGCLFVFIGVLCAQFDLFGLLRRRGKK